MQKLLIGLMAALLALPMSAQAARKEPQPSGEQRQSQAHKKARPRPAAKSAAPAVRVAPEPLYDTEKAMR